MHTDLGWSTNILRMADMSFDMGSDMESDIICSNYYLFRFKLFDLDYLTWIIRKGKKGKMYKNFECVNYLNTTIYHLYKRRR